MVIEVPALFAIVIKLLLPLRYVLDNSNLLELLKLTYAYNIGVLVASATILAAGNTIKFRTASFEVKKLSPVNLYYK